MKMGTAIGVGLANAVGRLKDSKAKSKVIIFMTDGENNSGTIDPETGLEIAKGYGIKIYTIGIGKDGETKLPIVVTDPFGNKVKRYQPFFSTINEDLLKLMASETGGKYWRATSARSMEEVFKEIDKLEKTKVEINKYTKYTELFPFWLTMAFFCLLFSLILERVILRRFP
jgi:Ca-activated chloride channel family protein